MIIYGTRSAKTGKETVLENCPDCKAFGLDIQVLQKYAHVFWIPFFPLKKTGIATCTQCNRGWTEDQMPGNMKLSFLTVKANTKRPIWSFSGLFLVAILVSWGVIMESEKNKKIAELVLAPKNGDLYQVKTNDGNYTLFRVISVHGDTIIVNPHSFETNKASGLGDLKHKGENAWLQDSVFFTLPALKQMQIDGDIYDIERKK